MKKKLKVLALFDAIRPTKIDQDLSKEMKTEDWKTEANVLSALGTLGHRSNRKALDRAGVVADGDAFLSLGTSGVLFRVTERFTPAPASAVHARTTSGTRSPRC